MLEARMISIEQGGSIKKNPFLSYLPFSSPPPHSIFSTHLSSIAIAISNPSFSPLLQRLSFLPSTLCPFPQSYSNRASGKIVKWLPLQKAGGNYLLVPQRSYGLAFVFIESSFVILLLFVFFLLL